eukprot:374353-Prymnesium_polylepis.2
MHTQTCALLLSRSGDFRWVSRGCNAERQTLRDAIVTRCLLHRGALLPFFCSAQNHVLRTTVVCPTTPTPLVVEGAGGHRLSFLFSLGEYSFQFRVRARAGRGAGVQSWRTIKKTGQNRLP